MSEVQEEYKGCRIFGIAVGGQPPYQCKCRIEKPFPPPGGWAVWIHTNRGRLTGGLFADEFKGRGVSGDFLGMRIAGTFEETTPFSSVFTLTGTIR